MPYLATIKSFAESQSKSFRTIVEAERWLDMNNNNMESTTYIEEFDDQWHKIGGFIYTSTKE